MIPYDPIVEGVRAGAALRYAERNPEGGNPFRASAIGGCHRSLALRATPGVKPLPRSARSALTLDHGTLRGKELALAFQKAVAAGRLGGYAVLGTELTLRVPVPCPSEHASAEGPLNWPFAIASALGARVPGLEVVAEKVSAGIPGDLAARVYVVGHADIAVVDPQGRISVGDFKSTHPFHFKGLKVGGTLDASYLAQLGTYHLGLARALAQCREHEGVDADNPFYEGWAFLPEDIELGNPWLLYESKDDHNMIRLVVPADQAIEAAQRALVRTADTLLALALARPLPARPYAPNDKGELPWQCRYCDVYETCWKGLIVKVEGDTDDAVPKKVLVGVSPNPDIPPPIDADDK